MLESGKCLHTFGHKELVFSASLNGLGDKVVTTSVDDEAARIWDIGFLKNAVEQINTASGVYLAKSHLRGNYS